MKSDGVSKTEIRKRIRFLIKDPMAYYMTTPIKELERLLE